MRKILVLAALESELYSKNSSLQTIHYTGVGKVNAALATTKLIIKERPNLILNIGTAGCLRLELLGGVFAVGEVIERDMFAEPLAPRGSVPYSNQNPILKSDFGTVRCATGDSFVLKKDDWLDEKGVDLVDMELFAIAKVAEHFGVEWRAIKFASDTADENAGIDWQNSLKTSQLVFKELLESIWESDWL